MKKVIFPLVKVGPLKVNQKKSPLMRKIVLRLLGEKGRGRGISFFPKKIVPSLCPEETHHYIHNVHKRFTYILHIYRLFINLHGLKSK